MPSPKSLVGRLLSKIKQPQPPAVKTSPPRPTTPPPIASTPATTAGAAELAQATQALKTALPGLLAQATEVAKSRSSSPAITQLLKAVATQQATIADHIKAKAPLAAAQALTAFEQAIAAVVARQQLETQKYLDALQKTQAALTALSAPVVAPDVAQARTGLLDTAVAQAAAGDHHAALELLGQLATAITRIQGLAKAYADALKQAKAELQAATAVIMPADVVAIRRQYINTAQSKALKGERQAALDLLAKVKPRCDAAKASMAQIQGATTVAPWWDLKYAELMAHRHKGAFKAEIAPLEAKRQRALEHAKQALGAGATQLFADIHWGSVRLLALADQHAVFVTRRDKTIQPLVTQLREAEPKASVAPLAAEIKAVEDLLAQADAQAGERLYEAAGRQLDAVQARCAATAALKQSHATFSQRVTDITASLGALPDARGTPFEAEATALRAELERLKALGAQPAELDAANAQLLVLQADVQEAVRLDQAAQAARQASANALVLDASKASADDIRASLAQVRQLLAQLQLHAGQPGITPQIRQIGEWLDAADAALKA
jgi:hypothetical protein